jgi:hypothetical protein
LLTDSRKGGRTATGLLPPLHLLLTLSSVLLSVVLGGVLAVVQAFVSTAVKHLVGRFCVVAAVGEVDVRAVAVVVALVAATVGFGSIHLDPHFSDNLFYVRHVVSVRFGCDLVVSTFF